MKKLTWINGNKARIETGHKTFDKQCECLSVGNVMGTCQSSSFIRPWSETECNGKTDYEPGHLQKFDLELFREVPLYLRDFIKTQSKSVILYELRHWIKKPYGENQKVIHAYLVTTGDDDHKLLKIVMRNTSAKSYAIVEWCKDYLSNP